MLLDSLHEESLDIRIALVVGIIEHCRPHLVRFPLLNTLNVCFVVVVGIEVGDIEFAIVEHHEYRVAIPEFSKQITMFLVVDAVNIRVEPHFASAQGAMTVALQTDTVNTLLGEQVATRSTSLDKYFREVFFEEYVLLLLRGVYVECNLYEFSLAIRVGGEIDYARTWSTHRQVVFLVASDACHVESLDVIESLLSITIHGIICGSLIVALKHLYMHHVFAHEYLVSHLYHLIFTILIEQYDVVDVGAVAHIFVLLQARAHEALLAVDIKLFVSLYHLGCLDGVKRAYLG